MELRDLTDSTRSVAFAAGALGDFVLTWPLLRGLLASGELVVVARPSHATLLRHVMPGCGAFIADSPEATRLFAGPDAGHAGLTRPGDAPSSSQTGPLSETLASADLLVSWLSDGRDLWADAARQAAPRARLVCLTARPPAGCVMHVQAWRREQLCRQGLLIPERDPPPRSAPGAKLAASPRRDLAKICLHPGSGGWAKVWPMDRVVALIDRLLDAGLAVRVVLGEVERERLALGDIDRLERTGASMTWLDDLVSLADAITASAVFVGNDAGPTHLAAQLGVPTVAMFGPTDPAVWAPIGPHVDVLAPATPSPMSWLDVSRVVDVVRRVTIRA